MMALRSFSSASRMGPWSRQHIGLQLLALFLAASCPRSCGGQALAPGVGAPRAPPAVAPRAARAGAAPGASVGVDGSAAQPAPAPGGGARRQAQGADALDPAEEICEEIRRAGDCGRYAQGLCGQVCEGQEPAANATETEPDPDPESDPGLGSLLSSSAGACAEVAARGSCATMGDLCPAACPGGGDGAAATPGPGPAVIGTVCEVLLELEGGCAHDLSVRDPSLVAGTSVSDKCPVECSGHSDCAPAAADVAFLGEVAADSSGRGCTVTLGGDACVDSGGVSLHGSGWVELGVGHEYAGDGMLTVAMWLLKAAPEVVSPKHNRDSYYAQRQVIFSHPRAEYGGDSIEISVVRDTWLDRYTLIVLLGGWSAGPPSFPVSLHRDSVPLWTHISVTVRGNEVQVYEDGLELDAAPSDLELLFRNDSDFSFVGCYKEGADVDHVEDAHDRDLETSVGALGIVKASHGAGWRMDDETVDGGSEALVRLCAEQCREYLYLGLQNRRNGATNYQWENECWCGNEFGRYGDAAMSNCDADGVFPQGVADICGFIDTDRLSLLKAGLPTQQGACQNHNAIYAVGRAPIPEFRGSGLASVAFIGAADSHHNFGLQGRVAMFQAYTSPLSPADMTCIYDSGWQLVTTGRLALHTASACRASPHSTGCTSKAASNGPPLSDGSMASGDPSTTSDDSSCIFEHAPGASTERGIVHVTGRWQSVTLVGRYVRPLVFCGVLTRSSTAQAVTRVANLAVDIAGSWSFEILAEQTSCHLADPPPLAERVSWLVVEAGLAATADGWQAGVIRVDSQEWQRASLHRPVTAGPPPVILTTVQNFEQRTKMVTVRHHLTPTLPHFSIFLQVEGAGVVWCPDSQSRPDSQYFAEYWDNLDMSGSPAASQCEPDAPSENWHACCDGIPSAMGTAGTVLFSARWSTRIESRGQSIVFNSHSSGGSRVLLDDVIALDAWEENSRRTLSSPQVAMAPGIHLVAYEYRSANSADAGEPVDSFAALSWTGLSNSSGRLSNSSAFLDPVYADVGWFACQNDSHGGSARGLLAFEAGYVLAGDADLVVDVLFRDFATPPLLFGGYQATDTANGGHLRLIEAGEAAAAVAIEFGSCGVVPEAADRFVGWVVMQGDAAESTRIHQQPTLASDVAALVMIATQLRLPSYLRWQSGTDPW